MGRVNIRAVAVAGGVAVVLLVLLGQRAGGGRAAAPESAAPSLPEQGGSQAPAADARAPVAVAGEPAGPEAEPPAELPAPHEPTAEDIVELMVDNEFGTLQILVLNGRVPAAGAEVLVHGRYLGGAPEDERALTDYGFSQNTDERGLATFFGVPGDTYDIRVLLAPFPIQQVTMIHATNRTRRVLVCFGGSALHGFAWDEEGQPLEGCVVTAEARTAYPGQSLRAWTRTAFDGSYLLDGLISNSAYRVHRSCGDADEHSVQIGLAAGEEKVVDALTLRLRKKSGLARWSGTVRDRNDLPVPGPGWVELERRENAALTGFRYDERGRFSVGLVPGTYSARVKTWNGFESLALIKVAHADVEFDLNVPGTRIVAHVSYYGTFPRPEEVTDRVGMSLSAPGKQHVLPNIRAGSTRTFLGVPPGDYRLHSYPNPIAGAPEGGVPVSVDGERTSIVVEVTVGDL